MDRDVNASQLAGSVPAHVDFSIIGMFFQADAVVKIVMLMLVLASIWSWAIIIEKSIRLRRVAQQADKFENDFWSGGSLDQLADRIGVRPDHPMAILFISAMREWKRSSERGLARGEGLMGGVQQRVAQVMRVTIDREMERLERYTGFLATVGSTAPFVGLFGTVWGIMNSFQSIAASKNTSLAVVAPGIAEALFATALGLVAAIPAVIAYNKITADLGRYTTRLEGFTGEFQAILSRQIDEEAA